MSGRGTIRGGRTLPSRGRRSSSRGRIALQVAPTSSPTVPSTQVPTNPLPSHVLPTPTPTPSPTPNPTPSPSPTPTPTPTPNPNPTALPSPIQPQTFEQSLPHTQSSTLEFQEDEHIDQECLPEIAPYGNELSPSTTVRFLSAAIKSKFDWFCPTWGHPTVDMQDLWFKEFKKYCKWEPKYDARIRQIFNTKGEARFRGIMYQERQNYAKNLDYKSKYIPIPIWNQLIHHWASDKKFKNWSVANIADRASCEGSSVHIGGSISMGEHARRMEEATRVKPSMKEVFARCHLKKDKSWVDDRAKEAFGEFKKRKTELFELSSSQNEDGEGLSCESQHMPNDLTIWKEVVPKGKKGTLYGLGSVGSNISSKHTTSSCSISFKETNLEQELVKWQEKVKEQQVINQEQKHKLEEQQKRIESNESMIVALFGKLNMPLPPNFACGTPMQNEPIQIGEPSNGDSDDNFYVD